MRKTTPLYARHEAKVDRRGPDECWPWLGALNKGHGVIGEGGGSTRGLGAHRVAYEREYGTIPPGLDVDHECHNQDESCLGGASCPHRACQNPQHLKAKTRGQNLVASSKTIVGKQARQTTCSKGHPLTGDNLYSYRGMRYCKECRKVNAHDYYLAHKDDN